MASFIDWFENLFGLDHEYSSETYSDYYNRDDYGGSDEYDSDKYSRKSVSKSEFSNYFDSLFGSGASANDMVLDFLKSVSNSSQGTTQGANTLAYLESLQQQQYSTSEREASQQWEEDWYNKYSSPSAMVRQYEEAGLNPALMYGNAGASTGDVASSSPASGAEAQPQVVSPFNQLDVIAAAMDAFDSVVQDSYSIQNTIHQAKVNRTFNEEFGNRMANLVANTANVQQSTANAVQKFNQSERSFDYQLSLLSHDVAKKDLEAVNNYFVDQVLEQYRQGNLKTESEVKSLGNKIASEEFVKEIREKYHIDIDKDGLSQIVIQCVSGLVSELNSADSFLQDQFRDLFGFLRSLFGVSRPLKLDSSR